MKQLKQPDKCKLCERLLSNSGRGRPNKSGLCSACSLRKFQKNKCNDLQKND